MGITVTAAVRDVDLRKQDRDGRAFALASRDLGMATLKTSGNSRRLDSRVKASPPGEHCQVPRPSTFSIACDLKDRSSCAQVHPPLITTLPSRHIRPCPHGMFEARPKQLAPHRPVDELVFRGVPKPSVSRASSEPVGAPIPVGSTIARPCGSYGASHPLHHAMTRPPSNNSCCYCATVLVDFAHNAGPLQKTLHTKRSGGDLAVPLCAAKRSSKLRS